VQLPAEAQDTEFTKTLGSDAALAGRGALTPATVAAAPAVVAPAAAVTILAVSAHAPPAAATATVTQRIRLRIATPAFLTNADGGRG
jgi:hypothetical protein